MQLWEYKHQKNTRGLYNWDMGGILSGGFRERTVMGWNLSLRSLQLGQKRKTLHSSPKRRYLGGRAAPRWFLHTSLASHHPCGVGGAHQDPLNLCYLWHNEPCSLGIQFLNTGNHPPQRYCLLPNCYLSILVDIYFTESIEKYPDLKILKYNRNTLLFISTTNINTSWTWRHVIKISGLAHLSWPLLAPLAKTLKWFSACLNLMILWL